MNLYRQSIVLFGIVIPILCGLVVIGVGYAVKSKMVEDFETKKNSYSTNQKSEKACLEIESQIKESRPHLERWLQQLASETASIASKTLSQILEKLPNKEIQRTSFNPTQSTTGFGQACAQESSSISIAFRGTFRTMQQAFLELETRMPQLQLNDFKMEPMSGNANQLTYQVSYTAWENRMNTTTKAR